MSEPAGLLSKVYTSTVNSYTMVFFSKNPWFGLLLMVVSFFDIYAGAAGLLSLITANALAWGLGLNRRNILSGFYGFNPLLTGLGLGLSFQPGPEFYLLLIATALATLFITLAFEGLLSKYALPYLTLPFLSAIWIATLAARNYSTMIPGESGIYTLSTIYERGGPLVVRIYEWFGDVSWPLFIKTYFKSLGAIFFQYHLFAGLLIAAGLLFYSRIAFLLSVTGFASAWGFYLLIGANMNELNYGFIGFNHILTAIAIGGFFMIASGWSFLWVILITPIISMITAGFAELLGIFQLPVYSLPFNLMVLLFLYAMKFREKMLRKPEPVAVQHYSPELNLYIGQNSGERFRNKSYLPVSLPFFGTWTVNQGHNGAFTHQEEWRHAWDFVITDEAGKEFSGEGAKVSDYYCFDKPVTAPANGWVEEIADSIDDNPPGEINLGRNWGNTIVIRHSEWLYSKLSHLKKGSIKVRQGSYVHQGQVIASCGNSGRSPFPHLHFQLQSTPYIGSATLDYPVSQYLSYQEPVKLKLYEIPLKNEQVSNLAPEPALVKAFHFIPGQNIEFSCDNGTFPDGTWKVNADLYKNQFIEDSSTGAKAYFTTDGSMFFFTHYEGSHDSLLYFFYLSAYKVPMVYHRDLVTRDTFPPSSFGISWARVIQDIVAPFYLFIKPEYKMAITERQEDLAGNRFQLGSSCKLSVAGLNLAGYRFSLIIAENRLQSVSIVSGKINTTVHFKNN